MCFIKHGTVMNLRITIKSKRVRTICRLRVKSIIINNKEFRYCLKGSLYTQVNDYP